MLRDRCADAVADRFDGAGIGPGRRVCPTAQFGCGKRAVLGAVLYRAFAFERWPDPNIVDAPGAYLICRRPSSGRVEDHRETSGLRSGGQEDVRRHDRGSGRPAPGLCVGQGRVRSEAVNKRLGLESRTVVGKSRRVLDLPMPLVGLIGGLNFLCLLCRLLVNTLLRVNANDQPVPLTLPI